MTINHESLELWAEAAAANIQSIIDCAAEADPNNEENCSELKQLLSDYESIKNGDTYLMAKLRDLDNDDSSTLKI